MQTQSPEADLIAKKVTQAEMAAEEGKVAEDNSTFQREKASRRKSQANELQPAPADSPALPSVNYFDENQLSDLAGKDDGLAASEMASQRAAAVQGLVPEMATVTASGYMWEDSPHDRRNEPSMDIRLALKKIKDLVDKGEQTRAEDEYGILLRECEECQLPETLELALKEMEETQGF